MITTPDALSSRPAWKALGAHAHAMRDVHLRQLFTGDPERGNRLTTEGAGLFLDYSKNRVTDETIALLVQLAKESRLRERIDAMFRARGSTSPRTGPCSTSRCALRGTPRSSSTARTSCPDVHAVLDRMAELRQPRPQRRVERPHRQAHPERRQHRHRRLGPRARDGLRGAQALQRARDDVPVRVERRRHDLVEATRDLDPAETLFIVSSKTFTTLETMTNARERARVAARRARRRRQGRGEALRRRLDKCREGVGLRHRHREHVRVLGLGGRPVLDGLGDRPVHDDRHRPGALPRDARRLPPDGRAFPDRALRAEPAGADGPAVGLVHRTSSAPRRSRSCRTRTT